MTDFDFSTLISIEDYLLSEDLDFLEKEDERYEKKNKPNPYRLELHTPWIIWEQLGAKDEYSLKFLVKFKTIGGMWFVIENYKLLDGGRFIIMRDNYYPEWDNELLKNGSQSFLTYRVNFEEFQYISEQILISLLGSVLTTKPEDIEYIVGMTYIGENNLKQLRFWLNSEMDPIKPEFIDPELHPIIFHESVQTMNKSFSNWGKKSKRDHKPRTQFRNAYVHDRYINRDISGTQMDFDSAIVEL